MSEGFAALCRSSPDRCDRPLRMPHEPVKTGPCGWYRLFVSQSYYCFLIRRRRRRARKPAIGTILQSTITPVVPRAGVSSGGKLGS